MKKDNNKKMLSDLDVEEKARIIKLHETNKQIKRHLLDMGMTRGTLVTVKRKAPMGDPIDIELRDYQLCIRKADLAQIEVEVIK